jgi:hypothetical protein
MELAEVLAVTLTVARVLEKLEIPYLLGGSLASSLHGVPRSTVDADLVADLGTRHIRPLVEALSASFYIDEERVADAVRRRVSFNIIHLATATKVDLFVLRADPFARMEMGRRQRITLAGMGGDELSIATAEDTILQKLAWFRLGGSVSERQWNDILGVLKVRRGKLDLPYLEHWAAELELGDLLRRALDESKNGRAT